MAPWATQSHNCTSTLASCKHGESDPNEPPKKGKTCHSKVSSEEMDVNEHEVDTVELKARDGKSGRRAKKTGWYVLPLIFLSFSFVHLLTTSIYSRKTAVDKNRDVTSFQDNNRPLSRLVYFFPPLCAFLTTQTDPKESSRRMAHQLPLLNAYALPSQLPP